MIVENIIIGIIAVVALALGYLAYTLRTSYIPPRRQGMYKASHAKPVLVGGRIDKDASVPQRWFGQDVEVARGLRNILAVLFAVGLVALLVYGVGTAIAGVL